MKNLIDRQAAIEALEKIFPTDPMRNDYAQGITVGAALATEYIKQLPSAQPERKKGKWMVVDADIAESSDICECDQCGGRIWKYKNAKDTWHFCPRCGADMRGEQNE